MPHLKPYKNLKKVFDDESMIPSGATAVSGAKPCEGFHYARIESITGADLVDGGGIDQTVALQGRCSQDGGWNAAEGTVTHTAVSETKISAVIDIRCYHELRLVYTKNGATAGTLNANVNLV